MAIIVVPGLLGAGFAAGVVADRSGYLSGAVHTPAEPPAVFGVFWEAWDKVQEHYVDRSALDSTRMTYGAVQGMLASLGDVGHTRFLTAEALKAEDDALEGRLEGIGAQIEMRDGMPLIVAPIPRSPAERAGVRAGDVVVRVDGREVVGLPLDQVTGMVRGPAGTSVTLTVIHPGEATLTEITVARAQIEVPNVTWQRLPETEIAHVLVSQFGARSTEELVAALNEASGQGVRGIILDLRNNQGGYRDEAVGVASQFLREGDVLIERDAQDQRTPFPVRPGGVALDIPMVVLVNEGSASSAEIAAGALQDHGRALLIGMRTFGTGTVLNTFRLSDGSAILVGVKEFLTPKGRRIWHQGVVPDVPVALPPGARPLLPETEGGLTMAQVEASQDTQLLRAVEELRKRLAADAAMNVPVQR